jgi:hypothetical protein
MTVGHPGAEGAASYASARLSGDPPWNAWRRTIAHSEGIVLQWYSRQRYFPCCAESWPSGRIPWHACEVPLIDSWAVSRCTAFFSRTLRFLYEWPERKSGQNCTTFELGHNFPARTEREWHQVLPVGHRLNRTLPLL